MKLTEITRSFSRKINLGNYETLDIFCSQKLEVPLLEAKKASKEAYEFCQREVMMSIKEIRAEQRKIKKPVKKRVPKIAEKSEADQSVADDLGRELKGLKFN